MEKVRVVREEKQNQIPRAKSSYDNSNLWDCGSTLYDSFELNSFKSQLDSAIANSPRTLSMPHLPQPRLLPLQPRPPMSKKHFNISRSFHKFLRSVFKSTRTNKPTISNTTTFQLSPKYSKDCFYVVYDESGPILSSIPEVPEFEIGGFSPQANSSVKRSASERFPATALDISCA